MARNLYNCIENNDINCWASQALGIVREVGYGGIFETPRIGQNPPRDVEIIEPVRPIIPIINPNEPSNPSNPNQPIIQTGNNTNAPIDAIAFAKANPVVALGVLALAVILITK